MKDFLQAYEIEKTLKEEINKYLEEQMKRSFESLVEHDQYKSWWKCFICHNVYPSIAELLKHYRKRTNEFQRLEAIKENSLRGLEIFDALYLNTTTLDLKLKAKLEKYALAVKTLQKLNPLIFIHSKSEKAYFSDSKYKVWFHFCNDKSKLDK
jgi:hypothetical protein